MNLFALRDIPYCISAKSLNESSAISSQG